MIWRCVGMMLLSALLAGCAAYYNAGVKTAESAASFQGAPVKDAGLTAFEGAYLKSVDGREVEYWFKPYAETALVEPGQRTLEIGYQAKENAAAPVYSGSARTSLLTEAGRRYSFAAKRNGQEVSVIIIDAQSKAALSPEIALKLRAE